ncbi:MAG: hypothetical protein H7X93_06945 [Sphingomonadaceae bacterium]|nr:hypothetical protein [Sphingomonadaceae bacterium]
MRQVKFTEARKDKFLAHFAGTCDARGAAAAAGVDHSTVYKHRTRHADFREAWQEALETGYARLEAELVRERLAAQERIRDAIAPEGEPGLEFERAIKLLMRWERRNGRLGARTQSPGRHRQPSFDEAIEALAKRLKSLDIPIKYLPAPEGSESGASAAQGPHGPDRLSASAPPAP